MSSAAGRNGGFLLLVGAPEDELLPALSVAAEPEPREKPPGTVEGVAKASLPADMVAKRKWITDGFSGSASVQTFRSCRGISVAGGLPFLGLVWEKLKWIEGEWNPTQSFPKSATAVFSCSATRFCFCLLKRTSKLLQFDSILHRAE